MARFVVITKDPSGFHYTAEATAPTREEAWDCVKDGKSTKHKPVAVIAKDECNGMPGGRPAFDEWVKANLHRMYTGETVTAAATTPITPGPRKPKPQVCPEVWRTKPEVDTTDYMAAVRAMCGDSK